MSDTAWDVTINGRWRASFGLAAHANNWASQFNLQNIEIVERSAEQKPKAYDYREMPPLAWKWYARIVPLWVPLFSWSVHEFALFVLQPKVKA